MNNGLKSILVALVALIGCFSCTKCNHWLGLNDDNPVEESMEWLIKEKTRIEVDLSGDTPE